MAPDIPLTHVYVPQAGGQDRLQRLDALTPAEARAVIVRLVERVEAAEAEAAAARLAASHAKTSSKRAKYATNTHILHAWPPDARQDAIASVVVHVRGGDRLSDEIADLKAQGLTRVMVAPVSANDAEWWA